jgi:hypothetical protein
MNHDLMKFHHWLLSSTFKSKWFEENIKIQIISILSWLIYKEFREQNNIFKILGKSKFLLMIISIFVFWSTTLFTFGRLTSTDEKPIIIKKEIVQVNYFPKGFDFESFKSERSFIEYVAKSKFKIKNLANLQKLPDDIFFAIISEIDRHKIPPSLFLRLLDQESNYLDVTNSTSGASGIAQLLPETRKSILKIIGSTNNKQIDDIRCAAYHLKTSYDFYKERKMDDNECWFMSLVDYNGGSHNLAHQNMMYFTKEFK